jgi:hypothetical protein
VGVLLVSTLSFGSLQQVAAHRLDEIPSPGIGLSVPWAVGGPRIEADGTLRQHQGEWPDFPVSAVRLWDTRTAWLNIEPKPGVFDFRHLDAHVSKAEERGVTTIILVLGGTPRWAATTERPTDAHWLGPGSASPPRKLRDWQRFVSAVVTRFQGRITHYEIWNEPNVRTFFSGSPDQWADLVQTATRQIRVADPEAKILASGFSLGARRQVEQLQPWLRVLARRNLHRSIDVFSFHWYPEATSRPADLVTTVRILRSELTVGGWSAPKFAITEMNVRDGARLSRTRQRVWIRELALAAKRSGIPQPIWYAWTDLGPQHLIQLHRGTAGGRALSLLAR